MRWKFQKQERSNRSTRFDTSQIDEPRISAVRTHGAPPDFESIKVGLLRIHQERFESAELRIHRNRAPSNPSRAVRIHGVPPSFESIGVELLRIDERIIASNRSVVSSFESIRMSLFRIHHHTPLLLLFSCNHRFEAAHSKPTRSAHP